jgi:FKBP-type peptidyl-prolyl cis-trans isomerase SlyD
MTFESVPGEAPDGELYTVTDLTDDAVVLDGNHPLAGMALRFDLEVDDVRAATFEEVAEERERSSA